MSDASDANVTVSFASSPWRRYLAMPTWMLPALSNLMQLGLFFAAAAALVVGMLGMR